MRFKPFELVHKVYGTCFVTNPRDAIRLDSGPAFKVQSAPRRLPVSGWHKTLLVESFDGNPAVIHEIWHRLYDEWQSKINKRERRFDKLADEREKRQRGRIIGGLR